jgi:hypothetical protein
VFRFMTLPGMCGEAEASTATAAVEAAIALFIGPPARDHFLDLDP